MRSTSLSIAIVTLFGCTRPQPQPRQAFPEIVKEESTQSKRGQVNAMPKAATYSLTGPVAAVSTDNDGSIYLAGSFRVEGENLEARETKVLRLTPRGEVDETFLRNLGDGFDGPVHSIEVAADGMLYAAGSFTFVDDIEAGGIVRLSKVGLSDPRFSAAGGFDGAVETMALGETLTVTGDFQTFGDTQVSQVAAVGSSGELETSQTGSVEESTETLAEQQLLLQSYSHLLRQGVAGVEIIDAPIPAVLIAEDRETLRSELKANTELDVTGRWRELMNLRRHDFRQGIREVRRMQRAIRGPMFYLREQIASANSDAETDATLAQATRAIEKLTIALEDSRSKFREYRTLAAELERKLLQGEQP